MSLLKLLPTLVGEPLPKHLLIALSHEGLHEIVGLKNDPELMKVLDWSDGIKDGKVIGADDDDEAYCSKGICAVHEMAGIRSTRNPAARSWVDWKDGVQIPGPAVGCTVIYERPPHAWQGHVNLAIGRDAAGHLIGFGYNQGNAVKASPFEIARVIGYRWPKSLPLPKAIGFGTLPLLKLADGQVSRDEA